MFLKLIFSIHNQFLIFLCEKVIKTITVHEMGVTTYYFDVLRLMLVYILGENSFCSFIWFLLECFGCYNFSISIFLP